MLNMIYWQNVKKNKKYKNRGTYSTVKNEGQSKIRNRRNRQYWVF